MVSAIGIQITNLTFSRISFSFLVIIVALVSIQGESAREERYKLTKREESQENQNHGGS